MAAKCNWLQGLIQLFSCLHVIYAEFAAQSALCVSERYAKCIHSDRFMKVQNSWRAGKILPITWTEQHLHTTHDQTFNWLWKMDFSLVLNSPKTHRVWVLACDSYTLRTQHRQLLWSFGLKSLVLLQFNVSNQTCAEQSSSYIFFFTFYFIFWRGNLLAHS